MWFFNSPQIVFGEGSLRYLENVRGRRACIVTDANLVRLGYVNRVKESLARNGLLVDVYHAIEPDPSLATVRLGATFLCDTAPDWIIALGGGSVIDAAKAMWVLYEHPDLEPEAINPVDDLSMGQKARLVAIPTTAGTGSEATWAVVLTDSAEQRKLGLGNRAAIPAVAILDPEMIMALPPRLTADSGLDALTHAIEGYATTWHNDFSDGLCLKAAKLVFDYLRRAYQDGSDLEARTHLQNAATIAGLGFGNAMAALAHGMGHSLGAVFHLPHGRCVALALPYTIEYCMGGEPGSTRYLELARFIGLPVAEERQAGFALAEAIRRLQAEVHQPLTLAACGVSQHAFEQNLELLVQNALTDSQTIMSTRIPEWEDLERLFNACWSGKTINY
ncbi:MAG TPA: iron-containing alcohol dehydrogenase [Levilinea sp.]|nr:iron-containing alcohol dehydrogenase [Levilinea sp.]